MSNQIVPQLSPLKEMQRCLNSEGDFANAVNLVRSRGGRESVGGHNGLIFLERREVFIYSSACPRIGQHSGSSAPQWITSLVQMHIWLLELLNCWGQSIADLCSLRCETTGTWTWTAVDNLNSSKRRGLRQGDLKGHIFIADALRLSFGPFGVFACVPAFVIGIYS